MSILTRIERLVIRPVATVRLPLTMSLVPSSLAVSMITRVAVTDFADGAAREPPGRRVRCRPLETPEKRVGDERDRVRIWHISEQR
jgi:hypothetical protein